MACELNTENTADKIHPTADRISRESTDLWLQKTRRGSCWPGRCRQCARPARRYGVCVYASYDNWRMLKRIRYRRPCAQPSWLYRLFPVGITWKLITWRDASFSRHASRLRTGGLQWITPTTTGRVLPGALCGLRRLRTPSWRSQFVSCMRQKSKNTKYKPYSLRFYGTSIKKSRRQIFLNPILSPFSHAHTHTTISIDLWTVVDEQRNGHLSFLATCHSVACWLNCFILWANKILLLLQTIHKALDLQSDNF